MPREAVEPASLFYLVPLPPVFSTVWTICDGLRVSFTTFGYKIRAVREELLQEHVYFPLALVQDAGFIPSSVTGFIPPRLSATERQQSVASSWLNKNPLADLCLCECPGHIHLLVSIHQNVSSYSLLSNKNGIHGDNHNSARI